MITNRPPHLKRIWIDRPVFFITSVSNFREPIFASEFILELFKKYWLEGLALRGWAVGEFVIMPDHVHFLSRPATGNATDLSKFIGSWKQWTARYFGYQTVGRPVTLWQPGFFDRLLRTEREWEEKRLYMLLDNPIRAGLAINREDWSYQGDLDMFRQ